MPLFAQSIGIVFLFIPEMKSAQGYFADGNRILQNAINQDNAGNLSEARKSYSMAIGTFKMHNSRPDSAPALRTVAYEWITKIEARIKAIETVLRR
jgi:hypothetical protein